MTEPDDMPARIWAALVTIEGSVQNGAWADTIRYCDGAEYVRADRVDELVQALVPFVRAAELFPEPPGSVEFDICIYAPAAGKEYNLCGDDLRRARAALASYREGITSA